LSGNLGRLWPRLNREFGPVADLAEGIAAPTEQPVLRVDSAGDIAPGAEQTKRLTSDDRDRVRDMRSELQR